MFTRIDIDIDDVLEGMNSTDRLELAKKLVKDSFDVEDMVSLIGKMGYNQTDILCCLEWDEVRDFVIANEKGE